jgi:DNA-binding NarL/FixJ family response regulator
MLDNTSPGTIRVLLVDDHPTVRQTLRRALEVHSNIEVVGEAGDGEEALVRVEHLQPAVVVMDIYMGRMDGITATRLIKAQYPQVAVIGMTIEQKDFQLFAMHKAGAIEVIAKENMAELPGAIRRAVDRPD